MDIPIGLETPSVQLHLVMLPYPLNICWRQNASWETSSKCYFRFSITGEVGCPSESFAPRSVPMEELFPSKVPPLLMQLWGNRRYNLQVGCFSFCLPLHLLTCSFCSWDFLPRYSIVCWIH